MTWDELLASEDGHLVVFALSKELQPREVLTLGTRRFAVVQAITKEQWEAARRRNYAVRERFNRRHEEHQYLASGEGDSSRLDASTMTHPPDPPEDCRFFYWAEEIRGEQQW